MLLDLAHRLLNFSLQEALILDEILALELGHDGPLGLVVHLQVGLVLSSRLQSWCAAGPWQKLGRYGALR